MILFFVGVSISQHEVKLLSILISTGVGKSTVAYLLSLALAIKVSVIQGGCVCGPSIPKLLGVENQPILQTSYGWKPLVLAR